MRKIKIIFSILTVQLSFNLSFSQILTEDFQNPITNMVFSSPSGMLNDTNWYNFDEDTLADGSGEGRPGSWYKTLAFAPADSLTGSGDTNFVFASNSQFVSPGKSKNWLITPSIYLPLCTWFNWKTAPKSTPFKLDGYKVLLSTTTNDINSFTDTIFIAAEFTGPGNIGGDFSLYDFSPISTPIHGWDGFSFQMSEIEYTGDSSKWTGVLTQFSAFLGAYPFQNVYLAFVHDSYDDNALSIDDIWVDNCGAIEVNKSAVNFEISPNPFSNQLTINLIYSNLFTDGYSLTISDLTGRIVQSKTIQSPKTILVLPGLSKGIYTLNLFNKDQLIQTNKIIKE